MALKGGCFCCRWSSKGGTFVIWSWKGANFCANGPEKGGIFIADVPGRGCLLKLLKMHLLGIGLRYWEVTMGGTTLATDSLNSLALPYLWLYGQYLLEAALGLTSCFDWVECRGWPLNP